MNRIVLFLRIVWRKCGGRRIAFKDAWVIAGYYLAGGSFEERQEPELGGKDNDLDGVVDYWNSWKRK